MTSIFRRTMAMVLTLTTASMAMAAPAAAANAIFSGRVLDADGVTPRSGVVITLLDSGEENVYSSEPTSTEGAFRIASAPAGSYTLLADTDDGAYLAGGALQLRPGGNTPVALTIGGTSPNYQGGSGGGGGSGGLPKWAKYAIAGALGVAAIFLIDDASDDDSETNSSDF